MIISKISLVNIPRINGVIVKCWPRSNTLSIEIGLVVPQSKTCKDSLVQYASTEHRETQLTILYCQLLICPWTHTGERWDSRTEWGRGVVANRRGNHQLIWVAHLSARSLLSGWSRRPDLPSSHDTRHCPCSRTRVPNRTAPIGPTKLPQCRHTLKR